MSTPPPPASVTIAAIKPASSKRGAKMLLSSRSFFSRTAGTAPAVTAFQLLFHSNAALAIDELHEAFPVAWVGFEHACETRGNGRRAGFADATGGHAFVQRIDHDGDAPRPQTLLERIGDLRGHCLLCLETLRIDIDDPRELRDARHAPIRQIGHMSDSNDRQHMMLAMGFDADIAEHHEIVIALHILESARQDFN